ncbi:hypothetical protein K438DRAFT_2000570 [Mycena galopus ATCC 62051]|nr:hypothetical protein K438DRAFT_2000570 [Mycena galopus ATCC 62051]
MSIPHASFSSHNPRTIPRSALSREATFRLRSVPTPSGTARHTMLWRGRVRRRRMGGLVMRLSLTLTSMLPPLAALRRPSKAAIGVVGGGTAQNFWRSVVHSVRTSRAATVVVPIGADRVYHSAHFVLSASHHAFARVAAHGLLALAYLPALPCPPLFSPSPTVILLANPSSLLCVVSRPCTPPVDTLSSLRRLSTPAQGG